ncbi:COQ9 family protein [Wolbachia endosymbiont of Diaphorina citri]|jgi:rpsU-divergently transcribed protein|uniref:COQ9 family protein n=1 Tax=unclassified Wolbachia TaxID=2640676 RepID=UPI0003010858|nr:MULTISPECIES: COQ9 family protein [unclassified Wolbachia]OAB82288.1 TetR family transcriptional regulator [Wolbachia endosymbiont of Laodelphax striatellus]QJT94635.1 COQ9 family protein [Wolbachia endosymbiont of Diaphorina citri]QJT95874.1 COQ9 family protein [Wolbachia endosymbiont of Diaphorina citri]QJT97236.1 COQ9 family protein [Wolbachia endosymbiont of Diaphorina citri]QLK11532.1 COQ9 family protein [Wolbachia endosymbiont of Diaphorina citri]
MEQKLIVDELIKVIPFEGISDATLLKACTNLNLANSFCKFQNGIYSALEYIAENLNSSMEAELRNSNLEDMKVRERVKLAIQIRLSNYAKLPNYRECLKNVLSFSILPQNTYFSSKLLYKTVSTIWYGIYDQSTDFNYYTKRAILAGVYLSTILFFINDYSEDFVDTLSFLDRRINNVMTFQKFKTRLKGIIRNFL